MPRTDSLDIFFNPTSVAVIGASATPGKLGHEILKNFIGSRFSGKVYPINPKWKEILGFRSWKSILEVQEPIELAIIVTPAKVVPKVLEECVTKGVKAAIVISGGFSEIGPEGAELEREMVKIARKGGLRIIGPNCVGVYDPISGIDTIFDPPSRLQRPSSGPIAIIAQSAAIGAGILEWADQEGIGVSKFISYGNRCDVDDADLLEYLVEDPLTKVIIIHIEGLRDGRRFLKIAREVSLRKAIVGLKTGRTKAGARAARSHSASMAGTDKVYDAAFKQAGIIRASTCEEALDFAKALAYQPLPRGSRTLIFGNSGGTAVIASDVCEELGIPFANLEKKTIEEIKGIFPKYTIINNPMDLTGDVSSEKLGRALKIAASDRGVDCVVLLIQFQTPLLNEDVVDIIGEVFMEVGKPFVSGGVGGDYTMRLSKELELKYKIPSYKSPERAVRALWALVRRYQYIRKNLD